MTDIEHAPPTMPMKADKPDVGLARTIGRWLDGQNVTPPNRTARVFYPWVTRYAYEHFQRDTGAHKVYMTLVDEAVQSVGVALTSREFGILARLVKAYHPADVVEAMIDAALAGAGLDPEHADRGITPYAVATLRGRNAAGAEVPQ